MRIAAAVLYDINKPYSIETVELDPPRRGEVLVKVAAAGVCRSDTSWRCVRRAARSDRSSARAAARLTTPSPDTAPRKKAFVITVWSMGVSPAK